MTTGCSTSVQRCILVVLGLAVLQEAYSSDMYQDMLLDKGALNIIKNRPKRGDHSGDMQDHSGHGQDHSGHVTECKVPPPVCDFESKYRTFDGSCNNMDNPSWGMADRVQKRLLPNAYDDCMYMPRHKGCGGKKLPNARHLSNIIHAAGETTDLDKKRSLFIMTFGQFLAHDMDLTPKFQNDEGKDLKCCGMDGDKDRCLNIAIPEGDQRFKTDGCMSFTRSMGRVDCDGIRQQVNMQSSYLDLSMAYGSSEAEARSLRTLSGGLLKSVEGALPVDTTNATCRLDEPDPPRIYCPKSGDPRTSVTPVLASLHTIIHREHNRLARALTEVNPSWDDEKLFQEARKINIGQWQHIVYNEYLPATIGSDFMAGYGGYHEMELEPLDTYNSSVDATVFNAFSTAAFRFGHSLIPDTIALTNYNLSPKKPPVELKNHFFNTQLYHEYDKMGFKYLLLGAANSLCPRMDRKFEDSVRNNLFLKDNGHAFDLPALNIQRGRDHGLPGYNEYREFCGLPRANHFHTSTGGLVDHSPKVAALLKEAYNCTDDIDLYTGMVSEKLDGFTSSQVGPTAKCLLLIQFTNLMYGDRFFYKRPCAEVGFTEAQLEEIKKVRMSTLFCSNAGAEYIQENMFLRVKRADGQRGSCFRDSFSDRVPCNKMHAVNITLWKEG